MAQKHEIELFISEEGEVKLQVKGIKGSGCLKLADKLAEQLGVLTEKNYTCEYYEKPITQNGTYVC
ncbi:MAG: DUF2997 domain-containing protein [Candidatus Omnitrophica bacterium]|nr:DUF2997 domain-containing protein [Candidatus Omnitrophota bacterium]